MKESVIFHLSNNEKTYTGNNNMATMAMPTCPLLVIIFWTYKETTNSEFAKKIVWTLREFSIDFAIYVKSLCL